VTNEEEIEILRQKKVLHLPVYCDWRAKERYCDWRAKESESDLTTLRNTGHLTDKC